MQLTMSFAAEFHRLALTLDDFGRKQLPFAAALALTRTAQHGRDKVVGNMPSVFDRPTPFTMNAVSIETAKKSRLEARIFVKDIQSEYLRLQEEGGTRQPKKTALVTPGIISLNRYGNIANRALARAKARMGRNGKSAVFVGAVRGVGGFWQRGKDGSLSLLARFEGPKQVTPHPFFFPPIEILMRGNFGRELGHAIEQAMQSARP
jgi:hypothetical protein